MSDNELICVNRIGIINLMHFYIYTCIYMQYSTIEKFMEYFYSTS